MRFRIKKGLNNDGFILIMAILLIGLLMIFMTAIVNLVNYTNRRTAVKSVDQQLQITAQSASLAVKDYLLERLSSPDVAGAIREELKKGPMLQDYEMEDGFINVKISKIKGVNKALVTIYATSREDMGAAGVTSFVIKLSGNGPKNELLDNLVVAYNPEKEAGSILDKNISNIDYKDVVMEGDILVDNSYRSSMNYGNREKYQKFADNMEDDTAVFLRNGMYTGVKTTGNLMLTGNIVGFKPVGSASKSVDFISSQGQMVIKNAIMGGSPIIADSEKDYMVSTIGVGGYTSATDDNRAGKLLIDDVEFKEGRVLGGESDEESKPSPSVISSKGVDMSINKLKGFSQRIFSGGDLNINSTRGKTKINSIEAAGKARVTVNDELETKSIISMDDNTVNGNMYIYDKLASVEGNLNAESGKIQARYFLAGKTLNITNNASCTDKERATAYSIENTDENYKIPEKMIRGDAAFIYFMRDAEGILSSTKTFEIGKAMEGEKPVEKLTLLTPNYYLSTNNTDNENIKLTQLISNNTENAYFKYTEESDGYLLKETQGGYRNFGLLILKGNSDAERKMAVMKDDSPTEVDIYGKTLYIDLTGNNDIIDDRNGERTGVKGQNCMDILLSPGDEGDTVVLNNKIVIRYSMPYADEARLMNMDYVRFFVEGDNNLEFGENFSIEYENKSTVHVDAEGFDFDDHHYKELKPDVYFMGLKKEGGKNKLTVKCKYLNAIIIAPYSFVDFSSINERNKTVFEGSVICKNFAMPKAGVCKNYKPFSLDYALSDDVFRYDE